VQYIAPSPNGSRPPALDRSKPCQPDNQRPEMLFSNEAAIVRRIQEHPALLCKADNVAGIFSHSKKNS
jgi:hypothetical protein